MEIWEQAEPSGVDKVTQEEYTTCYWRREDAMDTTLEHDHSRGQTSIIAYRGNAGITLDTGFQVCFKYIDMLFKFCVVWDRCRSQKF